MLLSVTVLLVFVFFGALKEVIFYDFDILSVFVGLQIFKSQLLLGWLISTLQRGIFHTIRVDLFLIVFDNLVFTQIILESL